MIDKKPRNKKKFGKVLNTENEEFNIRKKINPKLLAVIIFFTLVLLIFSTYAWLSSSLNVRVKFFNLVVSSDSGLFISLDGREFSDSVDISVDSVITNLRDTYASNTNQWAVGGLWPVSSNGISNSNNSKFDIYVGEVLKNKKKIKSGGKLLNTYLINENTSSSGNRYIAFDIFLKNVSGSPNSDNLYFDKETTVDFDYNSFIDSTEKAKADVIDSMSGIINSMRIGLVMIGSTSNKADVSTIQSLSCNSNCQMVIYEPNSTAHSALSIEKAVDNKITLVNGVYMPTYAVIKEGTNLEGANGQVGSGIQLDSEHFALQETMTSFDKPIFQIPNGISKFRVYVWIEGQDVDSLETSSKGAAISIILNLVKDLAGYE